MPDDVKSRDELLTEAQELRREMDHLRTQLDRLRDANDLYSTIIDQSPIMISIGSEGICRFINETGVRLLGAEDASQILGQPILKFIHSDYYEAVRERMTRLVKHQEPVEAMEQKLVTLDGRCVNVEIAATPLIYQGRPGMLALTRDISARKAAQETAREREEMLRAVFDTARDSIFIKDMNLRYVRVNPEMARLFGRPQEELLGKTDTGLFGIEEGRHITESDRRVLDGEVVIEEPSKPVGDKIYHFHTIKVPLRNTDGRIIGLCGFARDISARKQAEESLRRYQQIISSTPDHMAFIDPEYRILAVNDAFLNDAMKPREEVVGRTFPEVIGRKLFKQLKGDLDRCLAGEDIPFQMWFNTLRRGALFLDVSFCPCREEDGTVSGVVLVSRDNTERRLAEEAKRELSELRRTLFNVMPVGLILTDETGHIIEVNPAAERILGFSPLNKNAWNTEGRGWTILDANGTFMPKERHAGFMALQENRMVENLECGILREASAPVWCNVTAAPIPVEGYGVVIALTDISQRKQTEDMLRNKTDELAIRIKELHCLFEISELMETEQHSMDKTLQKILNLLPPAWQFPDIACACLNLDGRTFTTPNFRETPHQIAAKVILKGREIGRLIVCYLEKRPDAQEGPFLLEERLLLDAVAERLGRIVEREQSLSALHRREREFQTLAENSPDIIARFDRNFRFLYVNPAVEPVSGLRADEMVGKRPVEIGFSPSLDRQWYLACERVFKTGKASDIEFSYQSQKENKYYQARVVPEFSESGKIESVLSVTRDITNRKTTEQALKNSEHRVRVVLNATRDAVFLTGKDGCIITANEALARRFNTSVESLIGKDLSDKIPPELIAKRKSILKRVFQSGVPFTWHDIRDGKHLENTAYPVYGTNGAAEAAAIYSRDITDQVEREHEVLVYQDKLRALTMELSVAEEKERRQIAMDLHDSVGQLLAVAQIRLTRLCQDETIPDLREEMQEIIRLIERCSAETRSLTCEIHPPSLSDLGLEVALDEFAEHIERVQNITTSIIDDEADKPMTLDTRVAVFRLVRELMLNVVKHAKADVMRVSIKRHENELVVSVQDNGVGFDPAAIDHLDTRTGSFGLFSVRERLKHLGGRLSIDSQPNQGSLITMRVPLKNE
jgi:PAS domain S-box-containing protein